VARWLMTLILLTAGTRKLFSAGGFNASPSGHGMGLWRHCLSGIILQEWSAVYQMPPYFFLGMICHILPTRAEAKNS